MALRMANARESRAVLHEFFIETKLLIDRLYECDLIIIVVDGELAGKSRTDFRERSAIAAQ